MTASDCGNIEHPEAQNTSPEVKNALPQAHNGLPEAENGLPDTENALPDVRSGSPEAETESPEAPKPPPGMRFDILTLFPRMVADALGESIIGRAAAKGLVDLRAHNIRDWAPGRIRRTDDYPYGGGMGLVMLAEPLYRCHQAVCAGEKVHTVLMSAQGALFDQEKARELLTRRRVVLVCGHYEGVDERFIEECVDEELSIGDFVLTGGEIPAMAVADCVCRMVPGVLSEEVCFTDESHWGGLLEYPQYTRPEVWRDRAVPPLLLSGHHAQIRAWQRRQSLLRTLLRRPVMLRSARLSDEDTSLLADIMAKLARGEDPLR